MANIDAKCQECGAEFIRMSKNAFVCERGCGRLLSLDTIRELEKSQLCGAVRIQGLPIGRYKLDGAPGIWMRSQKVPHAVRATYGTYRHWFVRDTGLEREMASAMGFDAPEFSVPRKQR